MEMQDFIVHNLRIEKERLEESIAELRHASKVLDRKQMSTINEQKQIIESQSNEIERLEASVNSLGFYNNKKTIEINQLKDLLSRIKKEIIADSIRDGEQSTADIVTEIDNLLNSK